MSLFAPSDAPAWMTFQPAPRDKSSLQMLAQTVMAGNDVKAKKAVLKQKAVDDTIKGMGFDKWAEKLNVMSGDKLALLTDLRNIENAYTKVASAYSGDVGAMASSPYMQQIEGMYNQWMTDANTATESKLQYEKTAEAAKDYKNELVFTGGSIEPATDSQGNFITVDDYLKSQWFTINRESGDDNQSPFYIPDFGLTIAKGADADKALGEIFSKAKTADGTFNWEAIGSLGPEVVSALQTVLTVDPSVKSNAQQLSTAMATIYSKMDASVFTGISNEFHKLFGNKANVEASGTDFLTYAANYIRNTAKTYLSVDQAKGSSADGAGAGSKDKAGYFLSTLMDYPNLESVSRQVAYPYETPEGKTVLRGMEVRQHTIRDDKIQNAIAPPGAPLSSIAKMVRINGSEVDVSTIPGAVILSHTGDVSLMPMVPDQITSEYRPVRNQDEFNMTRSTDASGFPTGQPELLQAQDYIQIIVPEGEFEDIQVNSATDAQGKAVDPMQYLKQGYSEVPTEKKYVEEGDILADVNPITEIVTAAEANKRLAGKKAGAGAEVEARGWYNSMFTGPGYRIITVEVTRPATMIMQDPESASGYYATFMSRMHAIERQRLAVAAKEKLTVSPESHITDGGQ